MPELEDKEIREEGMKRRLKTRNPLKFINSGGKKKKKKLGGGGTQPSSCTFHSSEW